MKSNSLDKLERIAKDPFTNLDRWCKATNKKILGITLADVPDELIHAADILPFTIQGTYDPISVAGGRLPDNCCSLARSNLEVAMGSNGKFFNGYVLPQVCDATQHLSDIWRINVTHEFFESFLIPRQIDRPSAQMSYHAECTRLRDSLQEYIDNSIQDDKIWESIRIFNENRRLLRRLYDMKRTRPGCISNLSLFSAIKSSFYMDRETHTTLLRQAIDEISSITKEEDKDLLPIVLSGIVPEPLKVLSILDNARVTVVWDDMVIGSRYISVDVPGSEGEDPLISLTKRHSQRGPFSPIRENPNRFLGNLIQNVQKYNAGAVIYLHTKFCESQGYDYPDLLTQLKEQNIQTLFLETDFQTTSLLQLQTRLEAFFEGLRYNQS